jgi:hypothetical protein
MHTTNYPQHRLQWLSEQLLHVPVTHLRPTVFQENPLFWSFAARSIESSATIRLPFGHSRTSLISTSDVAEVLLEPSKYAGRTLELTGPRSVDMYHLPKEYSTALVVLSTTWMFHSTLGKRRLLKGWTSGSRPLAYFGYGGTPCCRAL